MLRACLHDVSVVSSNKVKLKVPVRPHGSAPRDARNERPPTPNAPSEPTPAPRGDPDANFDVDDLARREKLEGAEDGNGFAAVGSDTTPAVEPGADPRQVWSEGRTTWKGDILSPLRTPLFIVEITVVGDKGSEDFAFTQRLPAVKESALVLIDKAIGSTQVGGCRRR